MRVLEIDMVSDSVCPWCFIGKRRLEKAMVLLSPRLKVKVAWKPFQLNPLMPKGGMARNEYRVGKFGSLDYSRWLDAQVAAAGQSEGIGFRHDLMTRTPNTMDAHRLVWLAGREANQDAVVEELFRAYFLDGKDIGEMSVLTAAGEAGGLPRRRTLLVLESEEGSAEVAREEAQARAKGIHSVPTVVTRGAVIITGAATPGEMAAALMDAASFAEV
jgi:predicted DsbA family dithiol-disulfide isomerase